jgi:hypothetical protein
MTDRIKDLEDKIGGIEDKIIKVDTLLTELLTHFKSNPSLGHIGDSEQIKINKTDINKLKIDKKILLGAGAIVGTMITGAAWAFARLKSVL